MFIGHFAAGLALKRLAPRTNLGWLIAAVCFLDLLWPFFLFAGLERVRIDPGNTAFTPLDFVFYPFTHSLQMAIVWSIFLGGVYYVFTKYRIGAIALAIGVLSHWFLDLVVHRPDLPIYAGGEKYGFGLWNSIVGTVFVESILFAAGIWIYLRATRARDRAGTYAFWLFIAILVLSYLGTALGPPPASETAIFYFAPFAWIFVALAAWADRHREPGT
ncbi:MAG TPA: hypothetical protein VJV05_07455 [Pyrinomonadaceae bacterium]|nr:hypothetical protein [Pyrinomonadaceae bacterium]